MLAQVAIIAALVKLLRVFDGSDKTRMCCRQAGFVTPSVLFIVTLK